MSVASDLVDAVVSAINAGQTAGNYGAFTVHGVKDYALTQKLEEYDGVLCAVTPASLGASAAPQLVTGENRLTPAVCVSLQARVKSPGDTEEVDNLLDLVEDVCHEIETRLSEREFMRLGRQADPLYDAELLRNQNVFWADTIFTFATIRAE